MDIEIIWRGRLIFDLVLNRSIFHIQLLKYYISIIYDQKRFQTSKERRNQVWDFRLFQICLGKVEESLEDFFSKKED
jgi:hypothetical protein